MLLEATKQGDVLFVTTLLAHDGHAHCAFLPGGGGGGGGGAGRGGGGGGLGLSSAIVDAQVSLFRARALSLAFSLARALSPGGRCPS